MSDNTIQCIACHKEVPDDGKFMTCSNCKLAYHLGQTCSGIAPSTFTTMGAAKRDVWVCKTCRAEKKRAGDSASQAEFAKADESADESAVTNSSVLLELHEIKKSIQCLAAKVDSLLFLKAEVASLTQTVHELEASVSFQASQYDSILDELKTAKEQATSRDAQISALQTTVKAQAEQLEWLQYELNESEQYSRNMNMEIHGLPEKDNENLTDVLTEIAEKLELREFSMSQVEAIHRLPCKRGSTPKILIRFTSLAARDNLFDARRKLRKLFESGSLDQIYFNENLTRKNRDLFWRARVRAKERDHRFTWVKRGKIFVKKSEKSPLLRILRQTDLDNIV